MHSILVCGLPHTSEKIAQHYHMLGDMLGVKTIIYSRDVTGNSKKIAPVLLVGPGCAKQVAWWWQKKNTSLITG